MLLCRLSDYIFTVTDVFIDMKRIHNMYFMSQLFSACICLCIRRILEGCIKTFVILFLKARSCHVGFFPFPFAYLHFTISI